jgi:hypothetical protein
MDLLGISDASNRVRFSKRALVVSAARALVLDYEDYCISNKYTSQGLTEIFFSYTIKT